MVVFVIASACVSNAFVSAEEVKLLAGAFFGSGDRRWVEAGSGFANPEIVVIVVAGGSKFRVVVVLVRLNVCWQERRNLIGPV